MVARRQEHSREELTERVVKAAEEIGAAEGLAGITMRRLAAAVGYAPNSIYHAVGDMDAVILRLNAGTLARLRQALQERMTSGRTDTGTALAIADGYMAFVAENRLLWSILVDYVRRDPGLLPDWYTAALAEPVSLVEEALEPLFDDPIDRRRSVVALWAALHGVASLSLSGKLGVISTEDAPALARLVVRRYLAGAAIGA